MSQNRKGVIYLEVGSDSRDVRKLQIMWESAETCQMQHVERDSPYLRGHSRIPFSLGDRAAGEELF